MAEIEKEKIDKTVSLFEDCLPIFTALGDPIRQKLTLEIALASAAGSELNVSSLTAKTKLSRPAVSHHLKILKDSGIIEPVKIGTEIFYRLNILDKTPILKNLISNIEEIASEIQETTE